MNRTAYVCAIFFGPRRSWLEHWGLVDPLHCLNEHVRTITSHSTLIERVIFVCNLRDEGLDAETYAKARDIIEKRNEEDSSREWIICSRPNYAFSYGAWEHGLVEHTQDLDFAFLIEDDYVPCKVGFDVELIEKYFSSEDSRRNVIYCSSWWHKEHSAISNGIINLAVFRGLGSFNLPTPKRRWHFYKHGDRCQLAFLQSFTRNGFEVWDMSRDYTFPFFCMETFEDLHRGVEGGEVLIRPISYEGAARRQHE